MESVAEERWNTILDFPMYEVSNFGEIRNKDSGKVLRQSKNGYGIVKVGLFREGFRTSRSVALLVADAFVFGRNDLCNTPIHLNMDHTDNRADNLRWRPRWFAWKYSQQFDRPRTELTSKPIYEHLDKVWYDDAFEAAMVNGLLVREIIKSIHTTQFQPVWPTMQQFSFLGE
jgi:hypothetical protein